MTIPGIRFAGNVLGVAVGVGGVAALVYWFWTREGGDGVGLGLGTGKGGQTWFGSGGGGPSDKPGDSEKPGEGTGSTDGGTKNGNDTGGGGTKPTQKPGDGGTGGKGGQGGDADGGGKGGQGGGLGGGEGGGVGQGEGEGTSDGADEGGDVGEEEGGGENEGKYDPWGGQLIDVDLDPPDLSDAKLQALHATIYDLVEGAVLAPGEVAPNLPPPLHAFDPNLGGLLMFWADVALHYHYKLPPGRLDPDNPTHVPWINLWLDILSVVTAAEQEVNKDYDDDLDDEPENRVLHYGVGRESIAFRSFRFKTRDRREQRFLNDPLRRLLAVGRW